MEAVLMPLLAEARRRSVSHRRSRLSGLSFDLGRGGLQKSQETPAEPTVSSADANGMFDPTSHRLMRQASRGRLLFAAVAHLVGLSLDVP